MPDNERTDVGLDVKWGITRGLALDLTYNTDFAEAEADDQQVNLTRFSLFLREKREFFLENAGIFEFVPPSQIGGTPPLKLFFSRRIGIAPNGLPVPIRWGTRLTGRAGDWSIGVLDAETKPLGPSTERRRGRASRRTTGASCALKRNVGERSSVGMIFTNREQDGGEGNQVYGLDADLNPLPKLNVNTFFAGSRDPGVVGLGGRRLRGLYRAGLALGAGGDGGRRRSSIRRPASCCATASAATRRR